MKHVCNVYIELSKLLGVGVGVGVGVGAEQLLRYISVMTQCLNFILIL